MNMKIPHFFSNPSLPPNFSIENIKPNAHMLVHEWKHMWKGGAVHCDLHPTQMLLDSYSIYSILRKGKENDFHNILFLFKSEKRNEIK